jgi:hypothetical protein
VSDWREQQRQDRLAGAQIERDREAARSQARIAEREAAARVKIEAAAARRAARTAARADRAARLAAVAGWVREHVTDLLFVPVIGVPALLSWTAMAAFGSQLYGPAGLLLPAFSEGAAWSFAAATTITLRRSPGRPVWHLRAGTLVFAVFGALLNYVHGASMALQLIPGLPRGLVTGLVMAAVSVAGIAAHQLVTAGPQGRRKDGEAPPAVVVDGHQDDEAGTGATGAVPVADEPATTAPAPGAEFTPCGTLSCPAPYAPGLQVPCAAAGKCLGAAAGTTLAAAPAPVPTSSEHAAELAVRATHAAGNVLSARAVERQFGLTRSQATKLHRRVLKELIGEQEPELSEAQRRVHAWDESKRVSTADEPAPGDADERQDSDTAPEPVAV